ncbi:uncharacterized protein C8Q71DRAFT_61464 [Rhodofomes roseus]|uniref:F-box domain-containing protein n=1 Tax=Rhodofomes roseus TaxID=34475 RepID=A0ABQ8KGA9_9APHY|nr:uncharacterized protein C8Q71DRAFT_61464 [Rhodofomes roseus]KAH9836820.1 hypothetical protein C8Q71DRAFT_61464 [Rhodofomes roseus]
MHVEDLRLSQSHLQLARLNRSLQGPKGKLDKMICMLKSLQNHLCPANALPPDIWRVIFTLVIKDVYDSADDMQPDFSQTYGLSIDDEQLVTITTVCRYWYDVCISTPSLWNSINTYHIPQLQARVLKQHPDIPLEVTVYGSTVPTLTSMFPNPPCRLLLWFRCSWNNVRRHGKSLSSAGEVLKTLILDSNDDDSDDDADNNNGDGDESDDDESQFAAPRKITLFGDSTPCLETVWLTGLAWRPMNRFITAIQLLIDDCDWPNPISNIMDLLNGTPALQVLVISSTQNHWGTWRGETALIEAQGRPRLERLRRLHFRDIDGGEDGIALLLSKLDAPQAVVVVNDARASESEAQWLRLPEALSRLNLELMKPTNMELTFHLKLYKVFVTVIVASRHGGLLLKKKHLLYNTPADRSYRFASVFNLSQVRDLRCLDRVHVRQSLVAVRMWSSMLPGLAELEHLMLYSRSVWYIAHALNDGDWLARVKPLCPRMERIIVLMESDARPPFADVILKLARIHEDIPFCGVIIAYLPDYGDERVYQSEHDSLLPSIEYVDYDEVPPMETPWHDHLDSVDFHLPSAYWPSLAEWSRPSLAEWP